jgi:hypothetical protein
MIERLKILSTKIELMNSTRPKAILISEVVQLLLLCEPIWRAFHATSVVSIIGTFVICSIPATIILLATRRKKIWARDLLAGFALIAFIGALVGFGIHLLDPDWSAREAFLVVGWLLINLLAVALLYTDGAIQWFGELSK